MAAESDFTDSIHPVVADYRKRLAERGLFDEKDDYQVVRFLAQKKPELLDSDPTFGELYGKIREANAPSIASEASRGFKRAGIGLGETALAAGTLATDSDYLRRKTAALGLMASDPDLAPTIPTIDEIRSPRDALRYASSKVGEVVPSLAESLAVAGIGAAAGTAAAPGPGTAAGAIGGVVAKTAAKAAIRKAALRGAVTANAANSYALSSGEIYNETDDRGLALGLGAVAAIPDTILPTYVLSKFFPGVAEEAAKEAGKKFVARLATDGLKTSGIEASTESFQEAVNIVARNLKEERDPLAFDDKDLVRIREAGITGAFAGGLVAPAAAVGGRTQEEEVVAPPAAVPAVTPAAPAVPAPPTAATVLPSQRVRAMSPEAQVARLAELQTRARVGDEEAEYQVLLQTVPREAVAPVTSEVVQAVAAGNLPLAPTAIDPDAGLRDSAEAGGVTPFDTALIPPPPPTLAQIRTNETPVELGALNPPVPPPPGEIAAMATAMEQARTEREQADYDRATTAGAEFALGRGAVGESIAPELTTGDAAPTAVSPTSEAASPALRPAPATFLGIQEGIPGQLPPIELYILTRDIPGHPEGSSVSRQTLEEAGFEVPSTLAPETIPVIRQSPASLNSVEPFSSQVKNGDYIFGVHFNGSSNEQAIGKVIRSGKDSVTIERPDGSKVKLSGTVARFDGDGKSQAKAWFDYGVKNPEAIKAQPPNPGRETITPANDTPVGKNDAGEPLFERADGSRYRMRSDSPNTRPEGYPDFGGDLSPVEPSASPSPRPPSAELRLNNADLALKPLSEMSRAEKRAELDAAGITTYNGKPLDAANPAEISNAVGKLRRGELGTDPVPALRTSQTETPEFKAWFGESKVVDEGGKPLVVYKAMYPKDWRGPELKDITSINRPTEFPAFNKGEKGVKIAGFFGDVDTANRFADSAGTGQAVFPTYLSFKNPFVIEAEGRFAGDVQFGESGKAFREAIRSGKYDSVIIRNTKDEGTIYVALDPTQIKSAIGNRGTFDPTNPDITARSVHKTSTEPTNPAVQAQRTKEFQAVMGRLVANGANVQAMSQELLAQQTGETIQQQLAGLQQRLAQATTAPRRNELAKQIAIREQRMQEIAQMRGVTYSPYHIAVAMDDAMNASLDNLVTLLHEAAESLTMRLPPAQQGAVFRAVEAATTQMNARMQAAAKNTGATVADVPVPSELLAETMAQALAAEGIQDAPSLGQAIARWIKEIYYRVAMAAQRAFGGEPSPELALGWYENQLRRELGGDYEYSLARLLDRYLPQPNSNFMAKFTGATGTPGGMPDFFDPVTQKVEQPWVEPTSDEALQWNMRFQTVGVNPGEVDGIPADEAVARQTAAAYNEQIKWLTKLHDGIAPTMDMQEFLGLVSRGDKTPHEMLDALKTAMPGVETAVIGGERMTDAMNKWAAHQTLEFMKGVQGKHLTHIAQMQESVKDADERFTEHASELNRLESDVRNAELHEAELRTKARDIIDGLLKSYKNGIRTSSKLGMMVEAEENLGGRDPLPQFYAQAFANLLKADVPLFDYVEAIAMLDLPVLDMTPEAIWKVIRENADTSGLLRELSRNKPLVMTLSVLAKNSARQLDQIQLRRADADTFLDIRRELEGIRNATEAQLREMLKTIDEKNEAKGLRQRIKTAYLKERRSLKRASDRIALVEERINVLEKAKPAVAEKIGDMQQAIGGVFSEWTPADGAELIVMRRNSAGAFQKTARTLEFNKDGSAVDSDGILNDLAQNQQWLKANIERAGQKEYEQVKHQTRAMQNMDIQRAYLSHNYGKVIGFIDAFVRPLQAIAKQAGHSVGNRIVQQFNKYEFINRSGAKALQNQSYEWGAAMNDVMKSLGIKDVGLFRSQIYNPVKFWLGVNPGLDQAQAIRGAVALARKQSASTPSANFNAKFEAFLLKDKEIEDELLRTAEGNGVLVWDEKLGELRKAISRGWSTGMRMMNDGVVATLIHDMEKSGWKLEFNPDARKESRKVVTKSITFDALNPANATSPEERAEYYAQIENTEALRAAIRPYFTPGIINRWLKPFINKPGEPVFHHNGVAISQLDLQNAWDTAGGDVLTWIDNLGQKVDVAAEEDASPAATFRWDMLHQIERLFKWEAGMAYEAEQTPDLFSNQGAKLHVMMDARVNDLLPAEHVNFAMHDPTSVRQMLGQIAFHGAFGRNGAALMTNLKELEAVSITKKLAFDGLRSTTVEGRKREAKERGFDYNDLKRAVDHYHDVLELKGEIESAMGVKNIYGPLYDARAGMELLGFMVGQVVDQPKTGALNFLSIGARPFAMHSFSPKVLKATALSYGDLAKNTFGGLLRDFGIDIIRMSDYAKETGEVEGKAFRRLPYGTVLSGDPGKDGSFQDGLASRFMVQPLRIFRALQKKGVGPGIAAIPGLGTMQRFATEGAMASIRGQTYLLQEIINNGIRHFSTHPEDAANPAFRFDASNLKLKGDRGMYDWFRNKTVEYNMGTIEGIVRDAVARQAAGERTITTEMVEQLAQMNAQELDGASSINTAPAGLAQNTAFRVALPLLRWPLWMMHAAHEGLADTNGRLDFKSMMRGIGRLAAWNLPLGLAFTFMIDEYDEKILKKKNAMPEVSGAAAVPVIGIPLALATTPRSIPTELLGIGQRMIRSGNIYGLGADMIGALVTPFDPGSGQRAFSLDQRVLVMSQFLNLTQAISNMVSQGGTATWGSVYRPMVASIGGNGMLNSLDVVNNLAGLDNAESRLTQRINAARWVNTAAKELEIETKKASGFSNPTPMSVWTREMQLAAMANNRADFMDAYRKALEAARERVAEDEKVPSQDREKEAVSRVLASWRARNPFSGLASTPTPAQIQAMLNAMNEQGRADVRDAMRYYDAYTNLIKPSEMAQYLNRRMQAADPSRQMESMRRRAAAGMMSIP